MMFQPSPHTHSPPTYTYYQKFNFDPRPYVEPYTQQQYIQKPYVQKIPVDVSMKSNKIR